MNQDEINMAEWRNPDNWSGPAIMRLYFSKKDSRTWVPKPDPRLGWTINLGNKGGAYWLLGAILFPPLAISTALILAELLS